MALDNTRHESGVEYIQCWSRGTTGASAVDYRRRPPFAFRSSQEHSQWERDLRQELNTTACSISRRIAGGPELARAAVEIVFGPLRRSDRPAHRHDGLLLGARLGLSQAPGKATAREGRSPSATSPETASTI